MQVSQVNDHITHAVIGGHKAINFTVSDDADLMNVLSKALYTDQQLAVVRETMCNAWDIHIEAGISDKPFLITLDKDELVIRDFGPGIPLNLIGPIYGTYGGSTKKMNGQVTGGFGLGCKSPFAYTDHFEVTSWCSGIMTVYNMSKSSAEVQGKPGIIPIVSVPTTETGLQVRIKLKTPHDKIRFEMLIRRIAENGEMNCLLNEEVLEKLPFDKATENFIVTNKPLLETAQKILLRYGHVIYPVERDDEYGQEYGRVLQILGKMPSNTGYSIRGNTTYKIVFQTEPNTISITPSREALSMQEGTIATIKTLLTNFLNMAESRLKDGCYRLLNTSIETTWLNNKPSVLFEQHTTIPNIARQNQINEVVTNFDEFISLYASYSYPDYPNFKQTDHIKRLDALIESGFGDRRLNIAFRDQLKREYNPPKDKERMAPSNWFLKHLWMPLFEGLIKDPILNPDKLYIWGEPEQSSWKHECKLHTQKEMKNEKFVEYMPFLRKVVILTHNRLDFERRARQFPVMKNWMGKVKDVFLYIVARSPKKIEAATSFFQKHGYTILDLTKAQPWEEEDAAAPIVKEYTSRPKRKGIPMLSSCVNKDGVIDMSLPSKEETNLVSSPAFILKASHKNEVYHLPNQSTATSKFVIEQWGKLGGFVVNSNQEAKYISMGAATYEDFILQKIYDEFTTNPQILESLPFMFKRSKIINEKRWGSTLIYAREQQLLSAVYTDPELVDYFGLVQTMTEEDKLYWKMWGEFKTEGRIGTKGLFKQIEDFLDTIAVDPAVITLFDMIRHSTTLHIFREDTLLEFMERRNHNVISSKQRKLIRDMLLEAIEG